MNWKLHKGIIKRLAALALAILGLSLVAGMSAQAEDGVTADSIKVGSFVPLTGPISLYGVPMRAGTVAFFEQLNAKGGVNGRKIELITEDNAFSVQQTVAIVRKLATVDKVFAILNSNGAAQVAAILPYVQQQNIPVLFTYAGLLDWYKNPQPGLFGGQVLFEDQGAALGHWAAKDGHKKIVVAHFELAMQERTKDRAVAAFKQAQPGGNAESMSIKLGTQDYAPIALELISKKPDAIITFQVQNELAALARELRNQGANIPIYTFAPNVAQTTIALAAGALEGVKAVSWTISPFADTPALKEYRDALQKYAPDQRPDFTSLLHYAEAEIFAEALSRIKGPVTRAALYEALYTLKNYDRGILPPVTFAPDKHNGVNLVYRLQIQGGKWAPVAGAVDATKNDW